MSAQLPDDDWHAGMDGIDSVEDLVEFLEDHTSVKTVFEPQVNPDRDDIAMGGREIIRFRMGIAKPVGYEISAALRQLGFVHEYASATQEGSKYNPTRVIEQYWSRPAQDGEEAIDG